MSLYADRVRESTTSGGTGAIVLGGVAPMGFRTFASAFGAAQDVSYCIAGESEWEVGLGAFNGTTGLTRNVVYASSNGNAPVNFSAGTKDVFCTLAAANIGQVDLASFNPSVDLRFNRATMPQIVVSSDIDLTIAANSRDGGFMEFLATGDGQHELRAAAHFFVIGSFDSSNGAVTLVQCQRVRGSPSRFTCIFTPQGFIPATALTLEGPSGGTTNSGSDPFTVSLNGSVLGPVVVTPSAGSGGGVFDPATLTLGPGAQQGQFSYTPASNGTKSISVTNDGGLTNPAALNYVASAQSGGTPYSDNFSLGFPAMSGGGNWTLVHGTAPVNTGGKMGPGTSGGNPAGGDILRDFGAANGTYGVDITPTAGTFCPIMRTVADGSAETNYLGVAIMDTYKLGFYTHAGGNFGDAAASSSAVLSNGTKVRVEVVISGAPSAPVATLKVGGTTVAVQTGGAVLNGLAVNHLAGLMVPAAGVKFENWAFTPAA